MSKTIGELLQQQIEEDEAYSFYKHFEPWDVDERPEWIYPLAEKDGVDLYHEDYIKTRNVDPHPFQSGYLTSTKPVRINLGPSQGGKALTLDSDVHTIHGTKRMGDMKVGDVVLTPDGTANVVGVFPQGERPVYRFTFSDGSTVDSDEEHLWTVLPRDATSKLRTKRGKRISNRKFMQWETITTKDIISKTGLGDVPGHHRYSVPLVGKTDFAHRDVRISPYAMGAVLGDGSVKYNPSFTSGDVEVVNRMRRENCWEMVKLKVKYVYSLAGTANDIKHYELLGVGSETKFIPDDYKFNTFENRLALLRGLMDTDGSVTLKGQKSSPTVEISLSSKQLADDVEWIIQSLGGWCYRSSRIPWYYGKNKERIFGKKSYRLKINLRINPFYLKRKAEKWAPNTKHNTMRVLRKVEFLGHKHTQCIRIDSDARLFLTNGFIPTHNSVTAMIEIGCMCSGEFPISMQYDKGVDTGVKRLVNDLNIRRWGRYDVKTGKYLDHNLTVERDGSWDCGTIIGAGKYPKEKVIPDEITDETAEKVIWIGTTRRALEESWWPKMTKGQMLPEKFIDRTKGNKGTNQSDGNHVIHLKRGVRLSIISYESGYDKFEAVKVWACFFDEEASDRECVTAALGHCKYFASQMTPYRGMTYTKDIFVRADPNIDLFHATAYDSPYITPEDIEILRSMYPEHQIAARIWGEHTSEKEMPYYNAKKTRSWNKQITAEPPPLRAIFSPEKEYYSVKKPPGSTTPCLMDIEAKCELIDEDEPGKNDRGHNIAWNIFEDLIPDAAYCIVSDAANGADVPEDAGDFQAAIVLRKPIKKGETKPIMVAEIETTVTPDLFAQLIGLALRYYRNALLCAESPRAGSANGMFFSEMREYPYWFMRSIQKRSTNKFLTQQGFDTNAATRKAIFDEVEKVFGEYTKDEMPPIPSRRILQMAAECTRMIKNGKIKPDHPRNKPNDLLVCYGIGLVTFKTWPEQIKCRIKTEKKVAKYPKDCVISLLAAKQKKESKVDPHFPSNTGGRK